MSLFVAGQLALVLAAALGAAMVVGLTRRQETAVSVARRRRSGSRRLGGAGSSPPAWHPDPTGRFDLRYWDGRLWTEHVTRGGQQATDPV